MTVKDLRIKEKKTQSEMACVIGTTTSAYADKERGRRRFNVEEAVLLCREFSVSIEDVDDFCPDIRVKRSGAEKSKPHKRAS